MPHKVVWFRLLVAETEKPTPISDAAGKASAFLHDTLGRPDCPVGLPENREGRSRPTRLPSGKRAGHSEPPVHEEARLFPSEVFEKATCANLVGGKALELPHHPSSKHLVDVSEQDRIGLTTPPCGVPRFRSAVVPSSCSIGAAAIVRCRAGPMCLDAHGNGPTCAHTPRIPALPARPRRRSARERRRARAGRHRHSRRDEWGLAPSPRPRPSGVSR